MKFLLLVIAATACAAPPDCPVPAAGEPSRYCAALAFKNGKTVAGETVFRANDAWPKPEIVKVRLDSQLRQELDRVEKPYRFALDKDGRQEDDQGKLNDALTNAVRNFTGSYDAFGEALTKWRAAAPGRRRATAEVLSDDALYSEVQKSFRATAVTGTFDSKTGLFTFVIPNPPPCPEPPAGGKSVYCAAIAFRDGKSVLAESVFRSNGKWKDPEDIQSQLDKLFQAELAPIEKPYRFALDEQGKQNDDHGKLDDKETKELRTFSGRYEAIVLPLSNWAPPDSSRLDVGDVLSQTALYNRIQTSFQRTALLFDDEAGFAGEHGIFTFQIPDPFHPTAAMLTITGMHKPHGREEQLAGWMRDRELDGRLWSPPDVIAVVTDYYDRIGLDPIVEPSIKENRVTVFESPVITRVIFPFGIPKLKDQPDWTRVEEGLYSVFGDDAFRKSIEQRTAIRARMQVPDQVPAVDYKDDLKLEPPYVDRRRMQISQLVLQQFNLTASLIPTEENNAGKVQLALMEADDQPKKSETPPAAPAAADPGGHISAHPTEASPKPPASAPAPVRAPRTEPAYCDCDTRVRKKNNYLGAGITFRPGTGWQLTGIGQRNHFLTANSSISGKYILDENNRAAPSGNYFADYVGFGKLHRRVSVELRGGLDVEANRFLFGSTVNERRTGEFGRIEFEPFRDRGGGLLRAYGELGHTNVSLKRGDNELLSQPLNTADVGMMFLWSNSETPYSTTVRVEPSIRYAPGWSKSEPEFARGTLAVTAHKILPRDLDLDLGLHLQIASAKTPVFELPTLGGETLRGFRKDDGLGRAFWSAQPEFWFPLFFLPRTTDADIKRFLRRSVKLAGLVDVGSVRDSAGNFPTRLGPGLGVRFLYGPVVLKLDGVYGIGDRLTPGSRFKFYFSVSTNLPM